MSGLVRSLVSQVYNSKKELKAGQELGMLR